MTSYHTRWVRLPEQAEDPERIATHEALAFGEAVYIQLTTRPAVPPCRTTPPGQRAYLVPIPPMARPAYAATYVNDIDTSRAFTSCLASAS